MDLVIAGSCTDPSIQVVAIGNAYESAFSVPESLASLNELLQADEPHLSQKAVHWATPYGEPDVVVCRRPVRSLARPHPDHVICPVPRTTSICRDLLADPAARDGLLAALDRGRAVHLAAYIVTGHLAAVANWLSSEGLTLAGWSDATVELTDLFASKVEAQRRLYDTEPSLRDLRPAAVVAENAADLDRLVPEFAASHGLQHVVVKSALGAGGEGVFFVDVDDLGTGPLADSFGARGYNSARVEAPFLVEERIDAIACPTIDVYVVPGGRSFLCGAYEQRLYDERYFAGFHMLPDTERSEVPWYRSAVSGAAAIAEVLACRGYEGPLNVDFLITSTYDIRVAEINVRRSALLDGIGRAQRLVGAEAIEVSVADYVETDLARSLGEVESIVAGIEGVSILLDGGYESSYRWVSLLAVGPGSSEDRLAEAVLKLSSAAADGVAFDIGDVRSWR